MYFSVCVWVPVSVCVGVCEYFFVLPVWSVCECESGCVYGCL